LGDYATKEKGLGIFLETQKIRQRHGFQPLDARVEVDTGSVPDSDTKGLFQRGISV
jgi:hypothetical protein